MLSYTILGQSALFQKARTYSLGNLYWAGVKHITSAIFAAV